MAVSIQCLQSRLLNNKYLPLFARPLPHFGKVNSFGYDTKKKPAFIEWNDNWDIFFGKHRLTCQLFLKYVIKKAHDFCACDEWK